MHENRRREFELTDLREKTTLLERFVANIRRILPRVTTNRRPAATAAATQPVVIDPPAPRRARPAPRIRPFVETAVQPMMAAAAAEPAAPTTAADPRPNTPHPRRRAANDECGHCRGVCNSRYRTRSKCRSGCGKYCCASCKTCVECR